MQHLRHYLSAFTSLHTAKIRGHRAPHKAVLLLTIIDLVEEDMILSPEIRLTDRLMDKFNEIWNRYVGASTIFTPDVCKPFFHMQHERFWRLVDHDEATIGMAAEYYPYVEPCKVKKTREGGYTVNALKREYAYAEIDAALYDVLRSADARAMLRVALINAYLTNQPTRSMPDWGALILALAAMVA